MLREKKIQMKNLNEYLNAQKRSSFSYLNVHIETSAGTARQQPPNNQRLDDPTTQHAKGKSKCASRRYTFLFASQLKYNC